jgi:hypothetical protein
MADLVPPANDQYQSADRLEMLAGMLVSGAIPTEAIQSRPMLEVVEGRLKGVFFYAPAGRTPTALEVLTPDYLLYMDAVTGRLDSLTTLTPAKLRLKGNQGDIIARRPMLKPEAIDQAARNVTAMLEAQTSLMKPFAKQAESLTPTEVQAARDYDRLFKSTLEAEFREYYSTLGSSWFKWIARHVPK